MKTVALVGCGRISKRHIDAIKSTDGLELVLVCDVDIGKAKSTADLNKVAYETDYRKISGVDVISILTPSGLHPKHVMEIAEFTNIPYIVCEKPLSLTLREAYELFSVLDNTGKTLLPVYQNRYNPLVVMLKQLIDSGKLGTIYQFVCNVFWNRNDEYFKIDWHGTRSMDGGVLFTQASHYVDMVHFLFGEVIDYKGVGSTKRGFEVYDTVSGTMKFRNGVIGTLNATISTYRQNYLTEFTLISENGTIRLSGTNLNKIDFWDVKDMEKPQLDFSIKDVYGNGHNVMYKYIAENQIKMFPTREDILSGIKLMEMLSY